MAAITSEGPRSGYRERSLGARFLGLISQILKTRGAGFGLAVVLLVIFLAATADWVAPYDPNVPRGSVLLQPSGTYWFGTDHLGRDLLSRVIFGSRVAVEAGLVSVGFALTLGVTIGLVAGYWGGWVDDVLMRLVDAIWSFPTLVLALAIAFSLGQGLINAMIAIGVVFTPAFARLVRGQALSVRERDFVTAARVLGAGPSRIMLRHIWPNVIGPIIVQSSLMVAQAIIVEAALSFLGLGVEPPQASWGSMLRTGYQYMERAPWLSLFPGAAIFITVLSLNLLGDGLRLALDPRLRERGSA
ncbi:MAG: ABC transporter permease [Chloroflexi bacterium]|nr:ABC transporter permease [Chloroflexota bacterium]